MSRSISPKTRTNVAIRANFQCEYCRLSERVSFYSFHVEHIRSLKHGGTNVSTNLAYSCPDCNYHKGPDVGTFIGQSETLTRFFNPRKDNWNEHFELDNGVIHGKTDIGNATALIFQFNGMDRLIFRQQLMELGLYP